MLQGGNVPNVDDVARCGDVNVYCSSHGHYLKRAKVKIRFGFVVLCVEAADALANGP